MDDIKQTQQQGRLSKAEAALVSQKRMAENSLELRKQVQPIVKGKVGQPSKFTPELWAEVVDRIAGYEDLIDICSEPGMPAVSTIRRWYRENPELKDQIRDAWQDNSLLGHAVNLNILRGGILSTGDFRRDEAIVNENRWHMSKTNRRDFGDKTQIDVVSHQVFVLPGDAIDGEGY